MKEKITVLIADDNVDFVSTLKKYFEQKEKYGGNCCCERWQ